MASLHRLSGQQFLQDFAIGSKINLIINPDYWTANEPGLLQHQVDQPVIAKIGRVQAHTFYTGAAGIEHLAGRPSLEQFDYLLPTELVLEKIPVREFNFLLRKILFRFAAGISFGPTIKFNFPSHFSPPN